MASIELISNSNQNNIIYPNSRYNYHLIYTDPDTGEKFLETYKIPKISSKPTDITYTITPDRAFRPDLISYDFYNTPSLWWVFCVSNTILNPLDREEGLYVGRTITIPDMNFVAFSSF